MERSIYLEPKFLGPNYLNTLKSKVHREVEGTCSGRYGFVIFVTYINPEEIGRGKVQEGTGYVHFKVKFKAIVFRPFKGEVLDAVVTDVSRVIFNFFKINLKSIEKKKSSIRWDFLLLLGLSAFLFQIM